MKNPTQKLVTLSMLVTMASVLHILEGFLPALPIPGARLGLANIITLTAIIFFGSKDALAVAVGRTLLGALFGPGLISIGFAMSIAGALLSWATMSLVYHFAKKHFHLIGLSLIGAVSHNLAQLGVASLYFEQIAILTLLPILVLFAVPTGIMVGLVSGYLAKALAKIPIFRQ